LLHLSDIDAGQDQAGLIKGIGTPLLRIAGGDHAINIRLMRLNPRAT
jgi:hypothetical protein